MSFRLLLAAALIFTGPSPVLGNEKGRPDPSPLPLWSAKGTPLIRRQYVPGLNAALLLTDAQLVRLYDAWRETVDHPDLLEKGRVVKLSPDTTEAQRQEHRLLHEAAEGRLQSLVAAILTPAQKELMLSIEVLYGEAQEAVNAELAPEFALVKANAAEADRVEKLAKERLAADFIRRLSLLLTPEQRAARQAAAAEEARREAEDKAAPKKQ